MRSGITQAILAAAGRPGGMLTNEVVGHLPKVVSACCHQLVEQGRLSRQEEGRRVRYFATGTQSASAANRAPRRSHGPASVEIRYRTPTDLPFVHRPGSRDHEQHPSRHGNELIYRDGRREQVSEATAEGADHA